LERVNYSTSGYRIQMADEEYQRSNEASSALLRRRSSTDLAIVTGLGPLSEAILRDAKNQNLTYKRYNISSFPFSLSAPYTIFSSFASRSGQIDSLDPFKFSAIEAALKSASIKRIFFTGDFPVSRFVQAALLQRLPRLAFTADRKFSEYYADTDEKCSRPVRYFLALRRLLDACGARPLLASEIFPSFNLDHGPNSELSPPEPVLTRLHDTVLGLARLIEATALERDSLTQAAIIDNGIPMQLEERGINEMIDTYNRRRIQRVAPYLLKPPSVGFHPALDQPVIGPTTIEHCQKAGIKGIIVCAETTIVADKPRTIAAVNAARMYLYAMSYLELSALYMGNFPETWARSVAIGASPPSN
jgi:DUF1009 family protein